jgi:O-antigen ligase
VHTLLVDVLPCLVVAGVVLAIAWRSQTVAFVLFLFTLVAANSAVSWIQEPALNARWGALAALAVSVAWSLPLRWPARPPRPLALTLIALVAYALLSTLWSTDPKWTLMRTVSFGTLLWVVFAGIRPALTVASEARRLARGIVLLLAVVLATSVLYWLLDPTAAVVNNQLRGIFVNPSYLPLLLGLAYPLVAAQFDRGTERRYLALSMVTSLLFVTFIALCQSRAGLVAFLIGAMVYEVSRRGLVRLAVPLVAVAALTIVFQAWHPDLTPNHELAEPTFSSPGRLLGGHNAPGQSTFGMLVSGRNEAWSATIDLIEERPVVGYGFGTGDRLLDPTQFKHFAGISPHNAYLLAVLELGLLGAILLLGPLGAGLARTLRAIPSPAEAPEVVAFGAVLVGGLCDGLFEDVFTAAGSPFAPLIWLACAVVLVRVAARPAD